MMFAIARTLCKRSNTMPRFSWPLAAAAFSLALLAPAYSASAATRQAKINPPPSVELTYSIKAQQSGLNVKGDAVLRWNVSGSNYDINTETNAAMFGKILESRSEGTINATGLVPTRYSERRYRKQESVTQFDRGNGTVVFSDATANQPIPNGMQDRTSVIWQLVSIARTTPDRFKAGAELTFPVAGRRSIDPWTFKVIQSETIQTPQGSLEAFHIQKISDDHRDQEVDLWLAPSLQWYPVKLRYSDRGGLAIEQTLKSVK